MTAKIKRTLLCALLLLFGLCTLTACMGTTVEKEKERYNLTAQVTYHANGGEFSTHSQETTIYYQAGSKALDMGAVRVNGSISVSYSNHTLAGWYYAQTDEEGNVVYEDEENGIVALGEKVDFSVALKTGDEWHVYADWTADQKLEVLLASDESIGEGVQYNDTLYKPGELLKEYDFDSKGEVGEPSNDVFTDARDDGKEEPDDEVKYGPKGEPLGYSRVGYYTDEACTQAVKWPVKQTEEEENVKIYAKYLTDDWTVVKEAADVQNMLTNTSAEYKYYIGVDIDCSKLTALTFAVNGTFAAKVRGNGHTISNLKISNTAIARNATVSLFGNIKSGAEISDLTIKDMQVDLSTANNASVFAYLISSGKEEGAKVQNLVVDGGEMSVRLLGVSARLNGTRPTTGSACPIVSGDAENYGVTVLTQPNLTIK